MDELLTIGMSTAKQVLTLTFLFTFSFSVAKGSLSTRT